MSTDHRARPSIRAALAAAVLVGGMLGVARRGVADAVPVQRDAVAERPAELMVRATEAARGAEAFLRARGDAIEPAVPLTLDYLSRRFGLAPFDDLTAVTRRAAAQDAELRPMLRLLGPEEAADEGGEPTSQYQVVLLAALRCDPADPERVARLLELARGAIGRGGYELTHAAVALQWAVELGCVSDEEIAPLRSAAVDGIERIVASGNPAEEPALEASAVLAYIAGGARLSDSVVEALVAAQRPDGSWVREGDPPHDIDHATMLALWTLLEAAGAGARDVPMIAGAGRPVDSTPTTTPPVPPHDARTQGGSGCTCTSTR